LSETHCLYEKEKKKKKIGSKEEERRERKGKEKPLKDVYIIQYP